MQKEEKAAQLRYVCYVFGSDLGLCWIPDLKREPERELNTKWLEERTMEAED